MKTWTGGSAVKKKRPYAPKRKDSGRLTVEQFDELMPLDGHKEVIHAKVRALHASIKQKGSTK